MKKGFWAGLVAFVLAKISHLMITFILGLFLGITLGGGSTMWALINIIDSPILGIIYLVFSTMWIYKKITNVKE